MGPIRIPWSMGMVWEAEKGTASHYWDLESLRNPWSKDNQTREPKPCTIHFAGTLKRPKIFSRFPMVWILGSHRPSQFGEVRLHRKLRKPKCKSIEYVFYFKHLIKQEVAMLIPRRAMNIEIAQWAHENGSFLRYRPKKVVGRIIKIIDLSEKSTVPGSWIDLVKIMHPLQPAFLLKPPLGPGENLNKCWSNQSPTQLPHLSTQAVHPKSHPSFWGIHILEAIESILPLVQYNLDSFQRNLICW